jgi:hypothetical protein
MALPARGGQITKERGLIFNDCRYCLANRRPPGVPALKAIGQAQMPNYQGILSLPGVECPEAEFQLRTQASW